MIDPGSVSDPHKKKYGSKDSGKVVFGPVSFLISNSTDLHEKIADPDYVTRYHLLKARNNLFIFKTLLFKDGNKSFTTF